jgi:hypothetical protein
MIPMIASLAYCLLAGLGGVEVGDVPSYRFERPLFNGMGVDSLADLRGKPVFIEFWGRKGSSVDDSMREVLAWQEAFGDDLRVLLVEVKQATDLQVLSLALKKKWLGGSAMWTTELPCRVGLSGALPQFVLLSSDGVVLLKGTTESMELGYRSELVEKIEEHLREQVARRRSGPPDLEAGLVAAWEAFAEGRIGEALQLARGSSSGSQAGETLVVFRARLDQRLDRAAWQIENGYLLEAEAELARLEGQLAGEACEARHAELTAALRDPARTEEWKAAKDLAKLERKLYDEGSKSVLVKQLGKLAKKHDGTKCAERASYLFDAAQVSPYQ